MKKRKQSFPDTAGYRIRLIITICATLFLADFVDFVNNISSLVVIYCELKDTCHSVPTDDLAFRKRVYAHVQRKQQLSALH